METNKNFESRELVIDGLIAELAEREGMKAEEVFSDIITFAPHEGDEAYNPYYLDMVAEMIGISYEEMREYAAKKAKEQLGE